MGERVARRDHRDLCRAWLWLCLCKWDCALVQGKAGQHSQSVWGDEDEYGGAGSRRGRGPARRVTWRTSSLWFCANGSGVEQPEVLAEEHRGVCDDGGPVARPRLAPFWTMPGRRRDR